MKEQSPSADAGDPEAEDRACAQTDIVINKTTDGAEEHHARKAGHAARQNGNDDLKDLNGDKDDGACGARALDEGA